MHAFTLSEEEQFRFPGLTLQEELELLLVHLKVDGLISDSVLPLKSYINQTAMPIQFNVNRFNSANNKDVCGIV